MGNAVFNSVKFNQKKPEKLKKLEHFSQPVTGEQLSEISEQSRKEIHQAEIDEQYNVVKARKDRIFFKLDKLVEKDFKKILDYAKKGQNRGKTLLSIQIECLQFEWTLARARKIDKLIRRKNELWDDVGHIKDYVALHNKTSNVKLYLEKIQYRSSCHHELYFKW